MKFFKGNFFQEQERDGWLYGSFMPQGLLQDDRLEIKIKNLEKGFTSEPHFQKKATKIEVIFSGKAIWEIDGEDYELNQGDYIVIPPGVTTAVKKVLEEPTLCQTIKIPSEPTDKVFKTND